MLSARSLFVALTLATAVASAQPAPTNGGRPFGGRPGSNHGGPFTPGADGNPAGPNTPGTTGGGNGNGPFTPGTDGNPAGPYTPGTIDAPSSGGPFTRNDGNGGGGFWGKVKNVGRNIWGGIATAGHFIWTLGGYAPWAHMPAVGTLPNNGVGANVSRNENTNPTPPVNVVTRPGTPPQDLLRSNGGASANGATGAGRDRRDPRFFVP